MADNGARTVRLKIRRQDGPDQKDTRRWEEFAVPYQPHMNVISALMEIQKNPKTIDGKTVAPVVWDCSCLEEVCGACTMIINGRVRQACSALIDQLAPKGETIVLEPMNKFPLVRDLVVDRQRMFDDLKRVRAWIETDGTHDLGAGPRESAEAQEERYPLSRCMTCGCCLEACPQFGARSALHGRVRHEPGTPLQRAPHGRHAEEYPPRRRDGTGRHCRLRQGAELRRGVPERDPAGRLHCRRVSRDQQAHALRLATQIARASVGDRARAQRALCTKGASATAERASGAEPVRRGARGSASRWAPHGHTCLHGPLEIR